MNNCKIIKIEWKQQKSSNASTQNSSFSYTSSANNKGKRSGKNSHSKSSVKESKQKWMCLIQLRNIN